jgi:hypothetical protein
MVTPRQAQALASPLAGGDVGRCRYVTQAGDGALITTVLAVDR